VLLLTACVPCANTALSVENVKADVSDLKSAYIFNFIRFTDWPQQAGIAPDSDLILQVIDDPDVLSIMQTMVSKKAAREIGLSIASCVEDSCIRDTSALFIGKQSMHGKSLLHLVAGRPILTISDIPGFATHGGMIEIQYHHRKLTFIVNIERAKRAGLYISAQLLQLGTVAGREHE